MAEILKSYLEDFKKNQSSHWRRMSRLSFFFGLVVIALFLIGRINYENAWLEMPSHFVNQYVLLLLLFSAPLFYSKKHFKAFFLLTSAISITIWSHLYIKDLNRYTVSRGLHSGYVKFLSANVFTQSTKHQKVLDLIEQHDPDVVFLMEVNARWKEVLDQNLNSYPVKVTYPSEDNFGFYFASKIELGEHEIIADGYHPAYLRAKLRLDAFGGTVEFFGIHPVPPAPGRFGYANRNSQLREIMDRASSANSIVLGDLNISQWSPLFPKLLESGKLVSSCSLGFRSSTWSPFYVLGSLPSFLGIKLDHALHSDASAGTRSMCKVLGSIGSDHKAILAEYWMVNLIEPSRSLLR